MNKYAQHLALMQQFVNSHNLPISWRYLQGTYWLPLALMRDHQVPRYEKEIKQRKLQILRKQKGKRIFEHPQEYLAG